MIKKDLQKIHPTLHHPAFRYAFYFEPPFGWTKCFESKFHITNLVYLNFKTKHLVCNFERF